MKFLPRALLIAICTLTASLVQAQESASAELMSLLNGMQSVQGHFSQELMDNHNTVLQQSSGKVALQRPGKFRWETLKPTEQLLVADGKKIWLYDKSLQQVTVQKQQSAKSNSPAMLLSGDLAEIAKQYVITSQEKEDQIVYTLKPKHDGLFSSVDLSFEGKDLVEMKLHDSLGQLSDIHFSNWQDNVSPSAFIFIPPKDADIVTT